LDAESDLTGDLQRAGCEIEMIWFIIACLVLLWGIGYGFHVAGNLIHGLLIVAFALALVALLTRGKRV